MTKWKVNDAALYIPCDENFFYAVRILAIDENGEPLLEYMDRIRRGRHVWFCKLPSDRPKQPGPVGEAKLTRIGVYRRRFGFLWWYFIPNGLETLSWSSAFDKFFTW